MWSIFWELAGFGCGWGPMNARFDPWFGGYRHFLRPGTTKLPLFRGAPLIGGDTRNWLDVVLYAANQLFLLRALVAPQVTPELLYPIVFLIPAMAVLDKMLYLVCRAEHYFVVLVCMAFAAAATSGSRARSSPGASSGSGPRPRSSTATSRRSSCS